MIAVTGGSGLVGSRLLFDLISSGLHVRALKRKTSNINYIRDIFKRLSPQGESLYNKIEWYDFDILDPESVIESLEGITKLYHAAAIVSFNSRDKKQLLLNNIEGTANIVNACLALKIEKLCHVSSTAALGTVQAGEWVTEEAIWSPQKVNSIYSISKFRSEMEVWRGIEEGLNAVIINPSVILGPGFWKKGSSSMFSKIAKGLNFYTRGVTGFVSLSDVSHCAIQLMDSKVSGERYIISSENLSYKEVFDMIADSLHVKRPAREAGSMLLSIACQLDAFRSAFTGKRVITPEVINASRNKTFYSNDKVKRILNFEFKPVQLTIEEVSSVFASKLL
jgi:dihydroflavonol-4-reductase